MLLVKVLIITLCVSRRQYKMYCGHACLCVYLSVCVCLSVCGCMPTLLHGPRCTVTWGSGRGCPLVVHYWADLQSVHGLRCYGNITARGSFRRRSLSGSDEFPYSQCGKLYRYRNVRCTVTDQTQKKTRNF